MYNELCIDLGGSSVIISSPDKGIIDSQPCVMLVERKSGRIVNFGAEALRKQAQFPSEYILKRPLEGGIAKNLDKLTELISMYLSNVCGKDSVPSRVLFSIPCGLDEEAQSAIVEASAHARIPQAFLIHSPLCALLANQMDVTSSYVCADIGASSTGIMVICKGNVVYSELIRCGGDNFDRAIANYVYNKHNIKISNFTAENIKKKVGSIWDDESSDKCVDVQTRRADNSSYVIRVEGREMQIALEEPTEALLKCISNALFSIPSPYVNDVFSHGILLCGGGSLLGGLAKMVAGITGVDTYVFPSAAESVALGLCSAMSSLPAKMSSSMKNVTKFCLKSLGGYGSV